jgi:hypothetical protein
MNWRVVLPIAVVIVVVSLIGGVITHAAESRPYECSAAVVVVRAYGRNEIPMTVCLCERASESYWAPYNVCETAFRQPMKGK